MISETYKRFQNCSQCSVTFTIISRQSIKLSLQWAIVIVMAWRRATRGRAIEIYELRADSLRNKFTPHERRRYIFKSFCRRCFFLVQHGPFSDHRHALTFHRSSLLIAPDPRNSKICKNSICAPHRYLVSAWSCSAVSRWSF